MTRAIAAGVGSSTTLLAAAGSVLLLAGAILAFHGDGIVGVFDHATPLVVDDGPSGTGSAAPAQAVASGEAASRRDRAARRRGDDGLSTARTVAGRPSPDGIRHSLRSQPTTPGSAPNPTARPDSTGGGSQSATPRQTPASSPPGGGSGGATKPPVSPPGTPAPTHAPTLGGTVQGVTDAAGQTMSSVTQGLETPLGAVSPPLAETVAGAGGVVSETTTEAGKLLGSVLEGDR